jgi:hypothetical protein
VFQSVKARGCVLRFGRALFQSFNSSGGILHFRRVPLQRFEALGCPPQVLGTGAPPGTEPGGKLPSQS